MSTTAAGAAAAAVGANASTSATGEGRQGWEKLGPKGPWGNVTSGGENHGIALAPRHLLKEGPGGATGGGGGCG